LSSEGPVFACVQLEKLAAFCVLSERASEREREREREREVRECVFSIFVLCVLYLLVGRFYLL